MFLTVAVFSPLFPTSAVESLPVKLISSEQPVGLADQHDWNNTRFGGSFVRHAPMKSILTIERVGPQFTIAIIFCGVTQMRIVTCTTHLSGGGSVVKGTRRSSYPRSQRSPASPKGSTGCHVDSIFLGRGAIASWPWCVCWRQLRGRLRKAPYIGPL